MASEILDHVQASQGTKLSVQPADKMVNPFAGNLREEELCPSGFMRRKWRKWAVISDLLMLQTYKTNAYPLHGPHSWQWNKAYWLQVGSFTVFPNKWQRLSKESRASSDVNRTKRHPPSCRRMATCVRQWGMGPT